MATPLTVQELIAILEQAHPDSRIFLEGCDCINQVTKVRVGRPDSYQDYQGQLMPGFGRRNTEITRGWRELYPDREEPERRNGAARLESARQHLHHSLAEPESGQPRTWHTLALRQLEQAQRRLKAAGEAAPEPAELPLTRPPGYFAAAKPPELKAAAAAIAELLAALRARFQEYLEQNNELPVGQPATAREQDLLDQAIAGANAVHQQWRGND